MTAVFRLIPFELGKVLRKKSFIFLLLLITALNVFLLWYLNLPNEGKASLSAYKAVYSDLKEMSGKEQVEYLEGLQNELGMLGIVEQITILQTHDNERSKMLAERLLKQYGDVYDKYLSLYQSGEYLKYTSSARGEGAFIAEILSECETVASYDGYLKAIEENRDHLNNVSIFNKGDKDSFSSRNIEKSYLDHQGLTADNIRFVPSKGILLGTESVVTDLFMLLAVMLFVGGLIGEEKEKGLFYFTRATENGILKCMGAKLSALLIYCFGAAALLYGGSVLFAGVSAGLGDLSASLQSVSVFTESSLDITIGEYLLLGFLTKSLMLFGFGAALTAVSVISSRSFAMQIFGIGALAVFRALYEFIPAYSMLSPVKYLAFWGVFEPKHLFGEYLNFNIAGYPVSRLSLSIITAVIVCAGLAAADLVLFAKGKSLSHKKAVRRFNFQCIHSSLFLHEGGKILFMNKALAVLLLFGLLMGYNDLGKHYRMSVGEEYYFGIMKSIEGELTEESEQIITAENERYENAFRQIELIDEMISKGELDKVLGEDMKTAWQSQTAFYNYFLRVLKQYEHIKEHGGEFVYDTGYQRLFGKDDGSYLQDLLFLTLCCVFAFSGVLPLEEQKKSQYLLSATAKGKTRILGAKAAVCGLCMAVMTVLPWVFRIAALSKTYLMDMWGSSAGDLPMYYESSLAGVPLWLFTLLMILLQIIVMWFAAAAVMLISHKLKSGGQTVFMGLLIFALPLVVSVMGLSFMKWFSVYFVYSFSFV